MSESQARKKSIFLSKHVPYDIVYDILTWLPMKSIMRFRCVSKSCNSIITDPIFITTHLDKANSLSNNSGYLLYVRKTIYSRKTGLFTFQWIVYGCLSGPNIWIVYGCLSGPNIDWDFSVWYTLYSYQHTWLLQWYVLLP